MKIQMNFIKTLFSKKNHIFKLKILTVQDARDVFYSEGLATIESRYEEKLLLQIMDGIRKAAENGNTIYNIPFWTHSRFTRQFYSQIEFSPIDEYPNVAKRLKDLGYKIMDRKIQKDEWQYPYTKTDTIIKNCAVSWL